MSSGPAFLQQYKSDLEMLCQQFGIARMYAFGSVVTDRFTDKSDVDLLIKFDHAQDFDEFLTLHEKLERLFNREVDLLNVDALRNPYFIKVLNHTAQRIYG